MSYNGGYQDLYTEDEISAGIPSLLEPNRTNKAEYAKSNIKGYSNYLLDKIKNKELKEAPYKKRITKKISGINTKEKISNIIIHELIELRLSVIINNYAYTEDLPQEYIEIAKQKNCIEIFLKNCLQKWAFYNLNETLLAEIKEISSQSSFIHNSSSIYERVGVIQKYIHKKIDQKLGVNKHENLNTNHMKKILSAIRLHLNLIQIKSNNIYQLRTLKDKNIAARIQERKNPSLIKLDNNKKFIKDWKVRGMKTLFESIDSKLFQKKIDAILGHVNNEEVDVTFFRDICLGELIREWRKQPD